MGEWIEINSQEEFDLLIRDTNLFLGKEPVFKIKGPYIFNCEIVLRREKRALIAIINCVFKERVVFLSSFKERVSFRNVKFRKTAVFRNCHFNSRADFWNVHFEGIVKFNNTTFHGLADFSKSTFHEPTVFYGTKFLDSTRFPETTFKKNVLFSYALIDENVVFRSTIFEKGLDLSLATLNGSLSLFDIKLKDFETGSYSEDNTTYETDVANGMIPKKNKRETFRILKNQLQEQGNNFDALIYSSLETHTYRSQLWRKLKYQLSHQFFNRETWKTFWDYLILGLNYLSNKNGTSWSIGILFTFAFGWLFFYLSIINSSKYQFGFDGMSWDVFTGGFKYYFSFMIPTHKIDYLGKLKEEGGKVILEGGFYVWDFLGRIFVAYGIYQTIQAFRKFKG